MIQVGSVHGRKILLLLKARILVVTSWKEAMEKY